VTINKGMVFEVFTDQDHTVRSVVSGVAPGVQAAPMPGAAPVQMPASQMSMVRITSDIPGAEIEIDGAFIGSTPSTRQLTPGMHKITVRHGHDVWSRDLTVQGGEVTVNAVLTTPAAVPTARRSAAVIH
jgi:hypothetical protein